MFNKLHDILEELALQLDETCRQRFWNYVDYVSDNSLYTSSPNYDN